MYGATALTRVPVEDLQALLRHLHHGVITAPLKAEDLARIGLQYRQEDLLGSMRGLDEAGIRAVLVAVLAERRTRT